MENKTIPEHLLNKVFAINGRDAFVIKEYMLPKSEMLENYYLTEYDPGQGTRYIANIEKITGKGFSWYTSVLGKYVRGTIKYADIEKGIADVAPLTRALFEEYKAIGKRL